MRTFAFLFAVMVATPAILIGGIIAFRYIVFLSEAEDRTRYVELTIDLSVDGERSKFSQITACRTHAKFRPFYQLAGLERAIEVASEEGGAVVGRSSSGRGVFLELRGVCEHAEFYTSIYPHRTVGGWPSDPMNSAPQPKVQSLRYGTWRLFVFDSADLPEQGREISGPVKEGALLDGINVHSIGIDSSDRSPARDWRAAWDAQEETEDWVELAREAVVFRHAVGTVWKSRAQWRHDVDLAAEADAAANAAPAGRRFVTFRRDVRVGVTASSPPIDLGVVNMAIATDVSAQPRRAWVADRYYYGSELHGRCGFSVCEGCDIAKTYDAREPVPGPRTEKAKERDRPVYVLDLASGSLARVYEVACTDPDRFYVDRQPDVYRD